MLTVARQVPRLLAGLLACSLIALAMVFLASPASAGLCEVDDGSGGVKMVDCDTVPGHPGDGPTGPACELEPGDTGCYNGEGCLINNPSTIPLEDVPDGALPPKPGDDYHHAFRICDTGGAVWYWSQEAEPDIGELAMRAYGQLNAPVFTPTFNPPTRTIVNLDTWWWASGASTQVLSASAGSVTVIAEPRVMEVRPGDGPLFTCEFVTAKSDDCSHVYKRSSPGEGYAGGMRLVWDLTFTDSDDPIDIAGLPETFSSPWVPVTVPVREVQSVVTGVR